MAMMAMMMIPSKKVSTISRRHLVRAADLLSESLPAKLLVAVRLYTSSFFLLIVGPMSNGPLVHSLGKKMPGPLHWLHVEHTNQKLV